MPDERLEGESGFGPIFSAWIWLILSFFAGVFLAPLLFNGITWLGRAYPALEGLREIEFERVASRSVLLCCFLGLFPALSACGMARWRSIGLHSWRSGSGMLGVSLLVGLASMGGLYLLAWALGALIPESGGFDAWALRVLGYGLGGLTVGVIEEILFRGALFAVFRKTMGFWLGAIGCSLVFAAVHFAKPTPVVGVVYGHWYAGFEIMPHMFRMLEPWSHIIPFAGTLFFMGMTLCVLRDLFRGLYVAIGLHAGWVWIIRSGMTFFERDETRWAVVFGASDALSKSYAACLLAVLLFVVATVWRSFRARGT